MKNHEETYKDMKGNISLGHRKFLTRIKLKFVKRFFGCWVLKGSVQLSAEAWGSLL